MVALTLAAAVTLAAAAESSRPALADVQVAAQGDDYVASLRLTSGLAPSLIEEIEAGLETTIGYRLQVLRRRPGLPDETVRRQRIRCTVRFDALTRQYTLTRRVDDEVRDTRLTDDAAMMRAFLTTLDRVPVARRAELDPAGEYYLRARADIGLVFRFYLIPWPLDTDWVRRPIPGAPEVESERQP